MLKRFLSDRLQLAGLLVFGYLIVLAVIFCKERMIQFDSANYVFEMELFRDYVLPHGRWSSVLSQTIPLLLLKAGCSLKIFLVAYSVNLVAVWYGVFLVSTLVFKNRNAGIVLLFAMTAGFAWMFYYAISELLTGMTMSLLLYSALEWKPIVLRRTNNLIRYGVAAIAILLASFYHELALFPVIFICGFRVARSIPSVRRADVVFLIAVIVWSLVRLKLFTFGHSISGKILSPHDYLNQLPDLFTLPAWNYFVHYIFDQALWIGYVLVIAAIILVAKRKWILLLYTGAFIFAYAALIALTYYRGESPLMIETYLPPLGIYVALLFLNTQQFGVNRGFIKAILSVAVLISSYRIYTGSEAPLRRTDYIRRMTEYARHFEEKKLLLNRTAFMDEILIVPWALPYESVIYSSLDANNQTVTFAFHHRADSILNTSGSEIFLDGECKPYRWYPQYGNFNLHKTNYKLANTLQSDSSFDAGVFNCPNIDLAPEMCVKVTVPYHKHSYVNVIIHNSSGQVLRSVPDVADSIVVGYRIYDLQGREVQCSSYKTRLEADVYSDFIQCVRVESPPDAGDYILIVDLFNNGRWLNTNAVMQLHVPGKSPLRFLGF